MAKKQPKPETEHDEGPAADDRAEDFEALAARCEREVVAESPKGK